MEFTDYQCGFCRRFDNQTFPQLKKEFIDTGKVRFISMDLPLDSYDLARYCTVAPHSSVQSRPSRRTSMEGREL